MTTRRWGDNDRHFGPFLFARDRRWKPTAIVLGSGHDEYVGCNLRVSAFGFTMIVEMPAIIKPSRVWVDTSGRSWSTSPNGGYWDEHEREYGFTLSEGHLSVSLGRQTQDSSTEQRWGYFLPWTQWRYVRKSWYGLAGELLRTEAESKDIEVRRNSWQAQREFEDTMPKAVFAFKDFDGEELSATTHIEQMEWKFGTGYFKWLSLFRPRKVRRSLDIQFSGETGKRKGSWKGGTTGHSIDMNRGELHESAFKRYCAEHGMTFVGAAE
ncbi:hypothetical protein [Neorhizobium sp. AL 9.2.2]|uniref:hypothetical protein n=1 Tax=Neorhizobium sp. AL 9.2.2 TaxID=2712894 RepID=UPI0015727268|nr:hypothetical protein [Neorhizobium sp. AL 9.2.2]NSY17257.1 hypothetical protein [Neorhizobium sp. AL 9.2.2]